MFGFDFHTYRTDMMVSNGNLQFLWHALLKDKCYSHRDLSCLPSWNLHLQIIWKKCVVGGRSRLGRNSGKVFRIGVLPTKPLTSHQQPRSLSFTLLRPFNAICNKKRGYQPLSQYPLLLNWHKSSSLSASRLGGMDAITS